MNVRFAALAAALCWTISAVAGLSVSEDENGRLSVLRDGQVLVREIENVTGEPGPANVRKSFSVASDGAKVWNRWCEEKIGRFRLEVVERPDGAVEMSVLGEADGATSNRVRGICLDIPEAALNGKSWRAFLGNGRKEVRDEGTFKRGMKRFDARWLETDGLIWDFNASGPADYGHSSTGNNIHGVWTILPAKGGCYHFRAGTSFVRSYGGYGGLKLVLREGTFEDYDTYHFFRTFQYAARFRPKTLLAFGAPKFGADYAKGDLPFDAARGFGWVGDPVRKTVVGNPSGAYYSHVAGSGRATYRFAGLPDGWYVMTVQLGNFTGTANRFSVAVNGEGLAADVSVGARKARTVSRGVHVTGGTADFTFDGDWLVSAIGVQPLLSDAEDFVIRRAFWYVDGYEPSVMFRSADLKKPLVCATADETVDMPVPGRETAAPRRDPPAPVELPDPNLPSLAWLKNASVWRMGDNGSTLAEFDDPEWREKYIDESTAGKGYTGVMLSGMLSRHTFPHYPARGLEAVRRLVPSFRKRGIKVIDHFDLTLLWNSPCGFRVMLERLPEVLKDKYDNLLGVQFCMNNPEMKRKVFEYLRRDVEAGVDGFQLDEGEFFAHGCTCKACREKFARETGWQFPLDETSSSVTGVDTPLAKRWHEWRSKTISNWFVEARRFLKDLRPDVTFMMYTTHWGFSSSHPNRGASSDLIDLGRVINYPGTEVMTRNVMQSSRPLLPLRKMKNILTLAYGTPVWGWYYTSNRPADYFAWAVANMCGQAALLSDLPPDPSVPDYQAWGTDAANMSKDATAVARVAVLFSGYSRDWNRGVGFISDALGLAQELEALHIPYEFLGDMSVDARHLAKYRVLFVGTAQCLSDAEIGAIREFAAKGGRVYVTETAGTRNEIGELRTAPAFAAALQDPKSNIALMPSAAPFHARECSPPRVWEFDPDLAAEAEFRSKLAEMTKGAAFWRVRGLPDRVYTAIWQEKGGDLVIHFLNATGTSIKPGEVMKPAAPNPPYPELTENIEFAIPAKDVSAVTAASPDFPGLRSLAFKSKGDVIKVLLPKESLKAYTIVRIKCEEFCQVFKIRDAE